MPTTKSLRNFNKTYKTPRRPFEKERLDQELKLCGEYGLRCKAEIWRVQLALAKIRKAARVLLTLNEKDPKRLFEGEALLRRMIRLGVLPEEQRALDYVLLLNTQKLMERRLQTRVWKLGIAKSIHHARCLIKQKHISVANKLTDVPSFLVRVESDKFINFHSSSPFAGGKHGRVWKKKHGKAAAPADAE